MSRSSLPQSTADRIAAAFTFGGASAVQLSSRASQKALVDRKRDPARRQFARELEGVLASTERVAPERAVNSVRVRPGHSAGTEPPEPRTSADRPFEKD